VVMRALVTAGSALAVGIAAHTFVNLRKLRSPNTNAPGVQERVSVLIPARNEERHIEHTVHSILQQLGVPHLEVLVLNDGSTDRTGEILASINDDRLKVLDSPTDDLPDGWLGKPWACQRLGEQAAGEIIVFVDADVHLEPWALRALVETLRSTGVSLVAPYPRQLAETWLERLVQPLVTWSWVATMPVRWAETSLRPSLSAANGQLLVLDAAAYRAIGGHRAVQQEVIEDVALMRALKRAGSHTATVDGSHLASCRMYEGTQQVVDGYTKSLWSAFNGPAGSVAVNALLLGTGAVPFLALMFGSGARMRIIGGVGFAAGVASRLAVAQRTRERQLDAIAHPASIVAFSTLNVLSWWRHLRGTNTWKGRPVGRTLT